MVDFSPQDQEKTVSEKKNIHFFFCIHSFQALTHPIPIFPFA